MGVELTTVGRWERGETWPQAWCRPKLADARQVSLEERGFSHRDVVQQCHKLTRNAAQG